MEYDAIAYAQLGDYRCLHCGWGHVPHDDRNDIWHGRQETLHVEKMFAWQNTIDRYEAHRDTIGRRSVQRIVYSDVILNP